MKDTDGQEEIDNHSWQKEAWDRTNGSCYNCGSAHRVSGEYVVPPWMGGKKVASNIVLLCRPCLMIADSLPTNNHNENRPINFWVSRSLFESLPNSFLNKKGFSSRSALIRYLISKYIAEENLFDDLEQYQDVSGSDVVKVNAWVPANTYTTFKTLLDKRGVTVTDAIRSLVMIFKEEVNKERLQ